MRILVVDDEPDLCEILRFNLESEGFDVECAYSGEAALSLLAEGKRFSLMLLDVMMERLSGFDVVRRMRADGDNTPVVFLTALGAEHEQLEGFASGGDDYIAKPFSFPTVLARIRAVLKRTETLNDKAMPFALDHALGQALVDGKPVALTKTEFKILSLLVEHEGKTFSRQEIMEQVWDNVCVGDRSVDVHIARLRKKLGSAGDSITNRSGFGYAFVNGK